MNGELKDLYHEIDKRLTVTDTKLESMHKVNKDDITVLFKIVNDVRETLSLIRMALGNLPCEVHKEKMKNYAIAICFAFSSIAGIIYWIATIHIIK